MTGGSSRVESDWWRVVAAGTVVSALVTGSLGVAAAAALVGGAAPSLSFAALLVVVPLALAWLALTVALPAALLWDARAVGAAGTDWRPGRRYAVAAAVALPVLFLPLQSAVGGYYLSRRHEAGGTP